VFLCSVVSDIFEAILIALGSWTPGRICLNPKEGKISQSSILWNDQHSCLGEVKPVNQNSLN